MVGDSAKSNSNQCSAAADFSSEALVKTDDVVVTLSRPEALVLFEFLSIAEDATELPSIGETERRVIWHIHAELQRVLPEPFERNWEERLADAKAKILGSSIREK